MPKKFISCVRKVKRQQKKYPKHKRVNPYAVCRVATKYFGTSHEIGLLKPKKKKRR